MPDQTSAGLQIPLFDDVDCKLSLLSEPETEVMLRPQGHPELEYLFPYYDCDRVLQSKDKMKVHIAIVDRVSERRRKKLVRAGSYLFPPGPKGVEQCFKYYAPMANLATPYGQILFEHFLDVFLQAAHPRVNILPVFLEKIRKEALARLAVA